MASSRPLRHVDPSARRGPLYRAFAWLVGTRAASWLSPQLVWKLDPHLLRLTGGRLGMGFLLPTALLETRAAPARAACAATVSSTSTTATA